MPSKKANVTGSDLPVVESLSYNEADESRENDDTASDGPAVSIKKDSKI